MITHGHRPFSMRRWREKQAHSPLVVVRREMDRASHAALSLQMLSLSAYFHFLRLRQIHARLDSNSMCVQN